LHEIIHELKLMIEIIMYIYIYIVTQKKPNKIIAHFNMHMKYEISAVYLWLITSITKEHLIRYLFLHTFKGDQPTVFFALWTSQNLLTQTIL